MKEWLASHVPHLLGGGAISGSALMMIFRDELRTWLRERRENAKAERDAHLTRLRLEAEVKAQEHAGHDNITMTTLKMIQENLIAERENAAKMSTLLERCVVNEEKHTANDAQIAQHLAKIYTRLSRIDGAHGIQPS